MTGTITFAKGATSGIRYTGSKATYPMIKFLDNTGDNYGNGIFIGGGGATIIGGGESSDVMANQVGSGSGGSEIMYVGNDQNVLIISNLQNGWSSGKQFNFDTSGNLTLPGRLYGENWAIQSSQPANRTTWYNTGTRV